ncbi:hypothetical protein ACLOJK_005596 [Asimina triloba]
MAFASHSKRLIISRSSVSSLKSAFSQKKSIPASFPVLSAATSSASPTRLFSSFSRSRGVLGSVQSLLPLYSAVADARLTSRLSSSSPGSRSLSQGILCRTSPGL